MGVLNGVAASCFVPAVPGVPPWVNDPDWSNNEAAVSFGPPGHRRASCRRGATAALHVGEATNPSPIRRTRARLDLEVAARRVLELRTASVRNLLACDAGVVAKRERLGRDGGVLASVEREFAYSNPGRISPRFRLTRGVCRLAADSPARIRALATLRLHDTAGDVERVAATFTMATGHREAIGARSSAAATTHPTSAPGRNRWPLTARRPYPWISAALVLCTDTLDLLFLR